MTAALTRRLPRLLAVGAAALALLAPASVAAPATAAAPVAASAGDAAAAGGSPARAADLGAGWLAREITRNGGYVASYGSPDVASTAYAVLALHSAGVGRGSSQQAVRWLQTQLGAPLRGPDGADSPGTLAYVVLAAVAAGADPSAFGGHHPVNDLTARLLATARTSGTDRGLFGSTDPTYNGSYRQGFTLAALKAAGVRAGAPQVRAGIRWLAAQQCANGLWTSYRADTSAPCPAADPATFAGPDTNSTGAAAQGLAAWRRLPRAGSLLASLDAAQSPDGGFPFLAARGQASDPNSTALAVQAVLAAGGRPIGSRWATRGGTPLAALGRYQLGCSDPAAARGAFYFPGDRSANVLATVQAVPALALRTVPLAASTPATSVPTLSCRSADTADTAAQTSATATDVAVTGGAATDAATTTVASTTAASTTAAGAPGACRGTRGVTVAVDFKAFGGRTSTRCATGAPATGIAAMRQAGFTPAGTQRYGLAFVCRINNKPTRAQDPCISTPSADRYWSYYYALRGARTWTYSTVGASRRKPPQGSIEAWAFGAGARPSKTPAQVRASTS